MLKWRRLTRRLVSDIFLIVALDPFSRLQRSVFTNGRGYSYYAETPGLPLSLKSMSNGRALYKFGRNQVAVDDGGYLILNDGQPYSIEISSPTLVETFVLWFPRGWAEDVAGAVVSPRAGPPCLRVGSGTGERSCRAR